MKKGIKKIVSLLAITLMLTSVLSTNVFADGDVLPSPTNLKWGDKDINAATWEWEDEEITDVEFVATAKYRENRESESTESEPETVSVFHNDFNIFFKTHEGGLYSFSVKATKEGYEDSQVVWSNEVQFHKLQILTKTLDEEGNVLSENGGEISFGKYVESEESQEPEESVCDKTLIYPENYAFWFEAEPEPGYNFVRFEFDSNHSEHDTTSKKLNNIALDSEMTVTGVFQREEKTIPVKINFGSKHQELASSSADLINLEKGTGTASASDGVLTINWTNLEKVVDLAGYIEEILSSQLEGLDYIDEEEKLFAEDRKVVGEKELKDYEDARELYEEISALYEKGISVDLPTLYIFWQKEVTVTGSFEVEEPKCGVNVVVEGMNQNPTPEYTAEENNQLEFVGGAWIDEKTASALFEYDWLNNVTFTGGSSYCAGFYVEPKMGYFVNPDSETPITITVNGEEIPLVAYNPYGSYSPVPGATTESGPKLLAALVDLTAVHEWEFTEFEWDENYNAKAKYVCKGDTTHIEEVEATVTRTTTDGTIIYTASVSAEESLDKKEHISDPRSKNPIKYNLFIQGVQVNELNKEDILGDGKVSFDPETYKIVLNNANLETSLREDGKETDSEYGIRFNISGIDLIIELNGNSTITNTNQSEGVKKQFGLVVAQAGNTTFTGSGSLTVNMTANNENTSYFGIETHQDTVIDGANIKIDIPGSSETNGYKLTNDKTVTLTNKATLYVSTGNNANTYSFKREGEHENNIDLDVGERCVFEVISENQAVNDYFKVSESTKNLGGIVNTAASELDCVVWDTTTELKNYKYILIPGEYRILNVEGDGNVWYKGSSTGSTFVFKSNINDNETYGSFNGITVDEETVDPKYYTKSPGSVRIELKPEYLNSLSVGTYKLKAEFKDYTGPSADATFTVEEKKVEPVTPSYNIPKTGIE